MWWIKYVRNWGGLELLPTDFHPWASSWVGVVIRVGGVKGDVAIG